VKIIGFAGEQQMLVITPCIGSFGENFWLRRKEGNAGDNTTLWRNLENSCKKEKT
jgi:hypothetical protein